MGRVPRAGPAPGLRPVRRTAPSAWGSTGPAGPPWPGPVRGAGPEGSVPPAGRPDRCRGRLRFPARGRRAVAPGPAAARPRRGRAIRAGAGDRQRCAGAAQAGRRRSGRCGGSAGVGSSAVACASMRSAARIAATVSAREAATTRARPARACACRWSARRVRRRWRRARRAAGADRRAAGPPRPRRAAPGRARRRPCRREPARAARRSRRAARSRWPASWMSSSSSRRAVRELGGGGRPPVWTDLVRIGSYMGRPPDASGDHPSLESV